jgi:hypothetical protein
MALLVAWAFSGREHDTIAMLRLPLHEDDR